MIDTGVGSFDFMANAVWPEIADGLARLPFIFEFGIADVFHRNYSVTMGFLEKFESRCLTIASVKRLRSHPSSVRFANRPIYSSRDLGSSQLCNLPSVLSNHLRQQVQNSVPFVSRRTLGLQKVEHDRMANGQ